MLIPHECTSRAKLLQPQTQCLPRQLCNVQQLSEGSRALLSRLLDQVEVDLPAILQIYGHPTVGTSDLGHVSPSAKHQDGDINVDVKETSIPGDGSPVSVKETNPSQIKFSIVNMRHNLSARSRLGQDQYPDGNKSSFPP